MDARPLRWGERTGRLLDVLTAAPRQRRHDRPPKLARDLADRLGVGGGSDGESRLDDVRAERVERPRERELRRHVEREPWRLLAVPERGVEDDDAGRIISHALVVAAGVYRSQDDNNYDKITNVYGPPGPPNLPDRRPGTELLPGRGEGAPHAAGGEPGSAAARS